jgi:hypothetical protein
LQLQNEKKTGRKETRINPEIHWINELLLIKGRDMLVRLSVM